MLFSTFPKCIKNQMFSYTYFSNRFQSIVFLSFSIYTIDRKSNYYFPSKQIFSEVIIIDIEIKKRSIVREFLYKLHSSSEDLFFKIILRIPERLIPHFVMEWLDRYTTKRINQLNQEIIKDRWKSMYLEKAIDEISRGQQADK